MRLKNPKPIVTLVTYFFMTLYPFRSLAGEVSWQTTSADITKNKEKLYYALGCDLFNLDGEIVRRYPGAYCVFMKDGSFVMGGPHAIAMYDKNMIQKWRQNIGVHHQMNLSADEKELQVLSSSFHRIEGKLVRFDSLIRMDLAGNITGKFDFFENEKNLEKIRGGRVAVLYPTFSWDKENFPEVDQEYSHANSFYKVEEDAGPILKKGRYIVNVNVLASILIFDEKLKLVDHVNIKTDEEYRLHDVQVYHKPGMLLFYNNSSEHGRSHPGLYDIEKKRLVPLYKDRTYFSEFCGSVQELSDFTLVADNSDGPVIRWLSKEGKKSDKTLKLKGIKSVQGGYLKDLSSFVSKNIGI